MLPLPTPPQSVLSIVISPLAGTCQSGDFYEPAPPLRTLPAVFGAVQRGPQCLHPPHERRTLCTSAWLPASLLPLPPSA
jgi:hypothetical protein